MKTQLIKFLNHPVTIPAVVGVAGAACGFAAGVWYTRRKITTFSVEQVGEAIEGERFEVLSFDTIEHVRLIPNHPSSDDFDPNVIPDDFPQPPTNERHWGTMSVIPKPDTDELDDIVADYQPDNMVNIFLNRGDPGEGWDWASELEARSTDAPYIIHIEEFVGQESGYNQDTVTYYAADDVVVDDHDEVMEDYRKLMGELKFGHGSQDRNIVYIRNDKWGTEWEVLLDSGSYLESVVSEKAMNEIKHHRVPKFRNEE
jgi:hypothetical protein